MEQEMKKACEISMGTEVSEIDILNIRYLCDQVRSFVRFRRFIDTFQLMDLRCDLLI